MAFDQNNKFIKTFTGPVPKKPSGEQPGSGYTWGGGAKKPSITPIEKPSFGGKIAPTAGGIILNKPINTMKSVPSSPILKTPINKATDMSRTPSLPFSNKF
jgi:hypothetical protein